MVAISPICAVITVFIVALVDALGWRARGADAVVGRIGNTKARLGSSACTAAACWLFCGLEPVPAVWLWLALFAGSTLPWWDSLGVDTARRIAVHSGTCLLRVLPAAMLLCLISGGAYVSVLPLLLTGLLGGPAYRLAGSTERGEMAWGALRGASIAGGLAWAG